MRRIVCLVLFATIARAQVLPGAGGEHGWAFMSTKEHGFILVHVPPRPPVEGGTLRPTGYARETRPDRILAIEDRLFIFDAPRDDVRKVRSLRAYRTPIEGVFEYGSRSGPDQAEPPLPGRMALRGVAASRSGPLVLLEDDSGGLSLRLLRSGAWVPIGLPPGLEAQAPSPRGSVTDAAGWISVHVQGDAVSLVVAGGEIGVWSGRLEVPELDLQYDESDDEWSSVQASPRIDWAWSGWPRTNGSRLRATAANGSMLDLSGALVLAERTPARLELSRVIDGRIVPLASIEDGGPFALAGVGNRVVLIWRGGEDDVFNMVEVSVSTGAVFFEGEAVKPSVISLQDFQFLVVVLMSVMFGVLLFVLRGDEGGEAIALPDGMALASVGRRAIAWWIDYALLCWVMAAVSDTSFEDLLTLGALRTEIGMLLLIGVLMLGFMSGTIFEATVGRTPGKLVCRCVVARASDGGRPRIQQAFVRNLTKWLMPAILLQALVDPNRRHRADFLARTVVLAPLGRGGSADPD